MVDIEYVKANIACTECFDPYLKDPLMFANRLPKEKNILGSEMESFALFHNANVLGKKAACLLTVSDSLVTHEATTAEERQNTFTKMMEIALELA